MIYKDMVNKKEYIQFNNGRKREVVYYDAGGFTKCFVDKLNRNRVYYETDYSELSKEMMYRFTENISYKYRKHFPKIKKIGQNPAFSFYETKWIPKIRKNNPAYRHFFQKINDCDKKVKKYYKHPCELGEEFLSVYYLLNNSIFLNLYLYMQFLNIFDIESVCCDVGHDNVGFDKKTNSLIMRDTFFILLEENPNAVKYL